MAKAKTRQGFFEDAKQDGKNVYRFHPPVEGEGSGVPEGATA